MNEVQKTFLKFNFVYPKPKEHPFGCFLLLQQTEEKMINWFNMPDEGLSNGGLFEIKELEVTENGTYETKGEMYNKVTVNVEGGGGETWETVFEGSVTTASEVEETPWAELTEVADLSADTIKVTFNGVEYTCEKQSTLGGYSYGAPFGNEDWSEYPFLISITPRGSSIRTETAGTYTLKIEEPQSGGSSDFTTAQVTVIQEEESLSGLVLPTISNDTFELQIYRSGIHTVPLYKGSLFIMDMPNLGIIESVSGDIEELGTGKDYYYRIYGDCTITISY